METCLVATREEGWLMAIAEITQTCNDCAYYNVRNGACLEWRAPVDPGDICGRFIAADGSGRLKAVETKTKEPEAEMVAEAKRKRRYSGLTCEKVAELIIAGKTAKEIAAQYGLAYGTVTGHIDRALKAGLLVRVGHGKYAAPGSEPEAPAKAEPETAPVESKLVAQESDVHKIGEWILDFDARLRKMETRLADGLGGIADKLGDMQGSMLALRQAHVVTSQSVGGIKEHLEQVESRPDHTDRLLTILETQQRVMESLMRGRDDGDQD